MAGSSPAKVPTATTSATTITVQPKLPEITDSPVYRAAVDNLARLRLQARDLELAYDDVQIRRNNEKASREQAVAAVVAGATASKVRRDTHADEADHRRIYDDLKLTRKAIEIAEAEVRKVGSSEKVGVAKPFAATYRAKVRVAALAWLAYVKAHTELDPLTEHLRNNELFGIGGCDNPLPAFKHGPSDRDFSDSATAIRQLIEDGIIEASEVPAGLAIAPKPQPFVPTPPPIVNPKPPTTFRKAMRSLGVNV